MEFDLTKKEVLDLLDRIQQLLNMNNYSMAKHASKESIWLMATEKYNAFVKNYMGSFYSHHYPGARGDMQELLDKPLSDMPLYVNEGGVFQTVAVWRLSVGK